MLLLNYVVRRNGNLLSLKFFWDVVNWWYFAHENFNYFQIVFFIKQTIDVEYIFPYSFSLFLLNFIAVSKIVYHLS